MNKKDKDYRYIKGLIQHDHKIIEEIYAKYSKAILKMTRQNNGSNDDAKDVIQESLIIIYQKAKKGDFVLTSSFFSFFYGVCRNVWLKTLRKNKYKTTEIKGDTMLIDDINISEELNNKQRYEFYIKKLNELGEGCRQILQLHFDGKKIKEIVRIMGLSGERYASSRKHKCKNQLIKLIEKDTIFSEFIS